MKQPSIEFWKSTPRVIFMLLDEHRKRSLVGTEEEEVYADDVN